MTISRLTRSAMAGVLMLSLAHAQATSYTVTALGTLGGDYSAAASINDHGVITGQSSLPGNVQHRAFIYQNGTMTDLGLPGDNSRGNAINNLKQIVGTTFVPGGSPFQPRGFLYSQGTVTDLGTLGGASTYANGINHTAQVVGTSDPGDAVGTAFIYQHGSMVAIPAGNGSNSSEASAINDHGVVTGRGSTETSLTPFVYDNGILTILRDAQGQVPLGAGADINNAGVVTGSARFAGSTRTSAFLYESGVVRSIGSLGGNWSSGASLNERGEVVGASTLADGSIHNAFFYSHATGMLNLNDLIDAGSGWVLSDATSINEAGQIVGSGLYNGVQRAYLLSPVPEPASLALACVGAWMAWTRARRAKGPIAEPLCPSSQ